MSRIGNAAVVVPNGVDVTIAGLSLTVKGPKGTLSRVFPTGVSIAREENTIVVTRDNEERDSRARHGLVRTLVNNMMIGVTEGYTKELDIIGVGYRAEAQGPSKLKLALGFSHPVVIDAPENHRQGCRQRSCWSSCSEHSRNSQARALQGQGCALPQ